MASCSRCTTKHAVHSPTDAPACDDEALVVPSRCPRLAWSISTTARNRKSRAAALNEPRSPRDRDALRSVHSAADKRLAFVQEWLRARERHGKVNMAERCRRHCISRKTGYKWIERWDPNDPQS